MWVLALFGNRIECKDVGLATTALLWLKHRLRCYSLCVLQGFRGRRASAKHFKLVCRAVWGFQAFACTVVLGQAFEG